MKKLILMTSLLLSACAPVYASDFIDQVKPHCVEHQSVVSNTPATPVANASTTQNSGQNVNIEQKRQPVATAAGASSNTTADCRYLQANSVQFIGFGTNNTTMVRDLVCTLGKPLNDEQRAALCIENATYRKIRAGEGDPCVN